MEEQIRNEKTETVDTPTAGAEISGDDSTGVSLGKFKNTEALLRAYNSLEAEFTKRCQRIKELEKIAEKTVADGEITPESVVSDDLKSVAVSPDENFENLKGNKEKILQEYLKELLGAKSKAIVLDGAGLGIATPQKKPKTVAEAGEFFIKSLDK